MKRRLSFLLLLIITLSSCSRNFIKARIFERKEITDSNLLIKFRYKVEGKEYVDSTIVTNRVLNKDNIKIKVDPTNPSKAILALDK